MILRPDGTHEVRKIEQNIRRLQDIVGGYVEAISTDHCLFWSEEADNLKDKPCNTMATYLWWKIAPEMEGRDVLQGTVLVTGPTDEDGDSYPVPQGVIDLFKCMEQICRETEGEA